MLGFGGVWGMDEHNAENDEQKKDNGGDHPSAQTGMPKLRSRSSYTRSIEQLAHPPSPFQHSRLSSSHDSASSPSDNSYVTYVPTPPIKGSRHASTSESQQYDASILDQQSSDSLRRRVSDPLQYSSQSGQASGSFASRPRLGRSRSSQGSAKDIQQLEDDERDFDNELTSRDLDPSTSARFNAGSTSQPYAYGSIPPKRPSTRSRKTPPSPEQVPRIASTRHKIAPPPSPTAPRRPSIGSGSGSGFSSSRSNKPFDPNAIDLNRSSGDGSISYRSGNLSLPPHTTLPLNPLPRAAPGMLAPSSFFGGKDQKSWEELAATPDSDGMDSPAESSADLSGGASAGRTAEKTGHTEHEDGDEVEESVENRVKQQREVDTGSAEEGEKASDDKGSSGSEEGYAAYIENFPAMENLKEGEKTSYPIKHIQTDLNQTLKNLVSKEVFQVLLSDPMGRHRFQEHLAKEGKQASLSALAFWSDTNALRKLSAQLEGANLAIHETFLASKAPYPLFTSASNSAYQSTTPSPGPSGSEDNAPSQQTNPLPPAPRPIPSPSPTPPPNKPHPSSSDSTATLRNTRDQSSASSSQQQRPASTPEESHSSSDAPPSSASRHNNAGEPSSSSSEHPASSSGSGGSGGSGNDSSSGGNESGSSSGSNPKDSSKDPPYDPAVASVLAALTSNNADGHLEGKQSQPEHTPGRFHEAAERALEELYTNEFASFIKKKIVDRARIRLGMFPSQEERGDLGDVFCLTDPHQEDHPILMCSDGFIRLTEYPRKSLVGRNCRFLQGPSTDSVAVKRLRLALEEGNPICEIILNYKQTGEPFWNCLSMLPLRGKKGEIVYFIGGQVDISGALSSPSNLAFLIGAGDLLGSGRLERLAVEASKNEDSDLGLSAEVVSALEKNMDRKTVFRPRKTFLASKNKSSDNGDEEEEEPAPGTPETNSPAGPPSSRRPLGVPRTLANVGTSQDGNNSKYPMEVYTKLLVFDAIKHKVLFVTLPLLEQLGYPTHTDQQKYDSEMHDTSFVDQLILPNARDTERVQENVRTIVADQRAYSARAGLRHSPTAGKANRGAFVDENGTRFSMSLCHLTPMKNREGDVLFYAVIFGD